jgi:hypothetical protein
MRKTTDGSQHTSDKYQKRYPALHSLGLHVKELEQLQEQGYLEVYKRRGSCYWRLRFRDGLNRRILYVGSNTNLVCAIQEELQRLQSRRSLLRALDAAREKAQGDLKSFRREAAAALQRCGYHFHGSQVRKFRQ